MTPATAAYSAYVEHYPERLITVCQGGQVIRRSDRRYSGPLLNTKRLRSGPRVAVRFTQSI